MRVLLDENLPVELAHLLAPHKVDTVTGLGWKGINNGELLRRAAGAFEALITMDHNLEHQQPIAKQPFGVILVRAASNRIADLLPIIPAILEVLEVIKPGKLHRVGT
ncbi:MAG: hypothetical protein EHM23_26360 [Acidobacteria bacterium]|nr:MAG: hypothetical protein EHM23_26360 [Acidobacteriota bacterium]